MNFSQVTVFTHEQLRSLQAPLQHANDHYIFCICIYVITMESLIKKMFHQHTLHMLLWITAQLPKELQPSPPK
jgi:hypothetical protein